MSKVFPALSTIVGNVDVNALVGLVCSPLVDVAGGSGCTTQTVCCTENKFVCILSWYGSEAVLTEWNFQNGLITAGCNNIDA